jgi:preprotein translocase subunit SecE
LVGGSSPSSRAFEKAKINFIMKEKIINFFEDIYKEMKKVSWPKKAELIESTKVVIITMIISAILVYIIDKGISELLKVIF